MNVGEVDQHNQGIRYCFLRGSTAGNLVGRKEEALVRKDLLREEQWRVGALTHTVWSHGPGWNSTTWLACHGVALLVH